MIKIIIRLRNYIISIKECDMSKKTATIVFILSLFFLTSCIGESHVRKDLLGKPLISEDFLIIVQDELIQSRVQKQQISANSIDGYWLNMNYFSSSKNPNIPARWDLETNEFITSNVRYVFFKGYDNEVLQGKNGFTSILKDSMTIRGIKVGDTLDKVYDAYGKTEWGLSHQNSWYNGWYSDDYRLFYEVEIDDYKQNVYDSIEFEFHDGIVVGIYYHYMNSDEP